SLVTADAGDLPVGKSRVKQFDITQRDCRSIARLLLNDITRCKGTNLNAKSCLRRVKLKSRTQVPLNY
ncbi:MAG: hypothetical protein AAFR60_04995, partial [Pseudomonadota bacterium]